MNKWRPGIVISLMLTIVALPPIIALREGWEFAPTRWLGFACAVAGYALAYILHNDIDP